jgi:sec-independent protein translocase protein TatA
MPGWVSPWELLILLAFVLLLFGPKRLPEMGRSLGKGMREFKDSISGKDDDKDEPAELLPPAATTPVEDEPAVPASSKRDS